MESVLLLLASKRLSAIRICDLGNVLNNKQVSCIVQFKKANIKFSHRHRSIDNWARVNMRWTFWCTGPMFARALPRTVKYFRFEFSEINFKFLLIINVFLLANKHDSGQKDFFDCRLICGNFCQNKNGCKMNWLPLIVVVDVIFFGQYCKTKFTALG